MKSLRLLITLLTGQLVMGYDLICSKIFNYGDIPRHDCVLRDATDWDLKAFGMVGIPEGSTVQIVNAAFHKFDPTCFHLFQRAIRMVFWEGTVQEITFRSSTLTSFQLFNSWLVRFQVIEEENYTLKRLTIRSDLFSEISPSIQYLRSLEQVNFKSCGLTYVNFDHFALMKNLLSLDLSNNKIHTVQIDPDVRLESLMMIEIVNNRLTEIVNFLEALPALERLGLASNRWYCDWVTKMRDAIWSRKIIVQGADARCPIGISNNGGLCCVQRPPIKKILRKIGTGNVEAVMYDSNRGVPSLRVFLDETVERNGGGKEVV